MASHSGRCCRLWLRAPAVCCVFIHACTSFGFPHWLLIDGLFYFGLPFSFTVNSDRAVTLCLIFDLVCTVSCVCVCFLSAAAVCARRHLQTSQEQILSQVLSPESAFLFPCHPPAVSHSFNTHLSLSHTFSDTHTHTHTLYPLLALLGIPPGTNFPTFLPVLLAPVCSVSLY